MNLARVRDKDTARSFKAPFRITEEPREERYPFLPRSQNRPNFFNTWSWKLIFFENLDWVNRKRFSTSFLEIIFFSDPLSPYPVASGSKTIPFSPRNFPVLKMVRNITASNTKLYVNSKITTHSAMFEP